MAIRKSADNLCNLVVWTLWHLRWTRFILKMSSKCHLKMRRLRWQSWKASCFKLRSIWMQIYPENENVTLSNNRKLCKSTLSLKSRRQLKSIPQVLRSTKTRKLRRLSCLPLFSICAQNKSWLLRPVEIKMESLLSVHLSKTKTYRHSIIKALKSTNN